MAVYWLDNLQLVVAVLVELVAEAVAAAAAAEAVELIAVVTAVVELVATTNKPTGCGSGESMRLFDLEITAKYHLYHTTPC